MGFLEYAQKSDRFEIVDEPQEPSGGFLQHAASSPRFEIVDEPAKPKRHPMTHRPMKPASGNDLPESRAGVLGDVGSGFLKGVQQAFKMPWEAVRGMDQPGGNDVVRDYATKQIDYLDSFDETYPRLLKPSRETMANPVRKTIYQTFQAAVPSVTYGTLGVMAGGGAAGFVMGSSGMFSASEFDRRMEAGLKKGKSYSETLPYAAASAAVEGLGEGLSTWIGAKLFGLTGSSLLPFKNTVKEMLSKSAADVAKAIGKQMPVEVGTEMGQAAAQTGIANLQGISDESPWNAAVDTIGVAIGMTLLLGGGAHMFSGAQRKQMQKALSDERVPQDERLQAAAAVSRSLKAKDPDLANMWDRTALTYINDNRPIPIDVKTADWLARRDPAKMPDREDAEQPMGTGQDGIKDIASAGSRKTAVDEQSVSHDEPNMPSDEQLAAAALDDIIKDRPTEPQPGDLVSGTVPIERPTDEDVIDLLNDVEPRAEAAQPPALPAPREAVPEEAAGVPFSPAPDVVPEPPSAPPIRLGSYFKGDERAKAVPVSQLRQTEDVNPGKLARTHRNMDDAAQGQGPSRAPIEVVDRGDGTYAILDGNHTVQALKDRGINYAPVVVKRYITQSRDQIKGLSDLYRHAEAAWPHMEKLTVGHAENTGGKVRMRGGNDNIASRLKSRESTERKLRSEEDYDAARIKDMVATTITYPDEAAMRRGMQEILKDKRIIQMVDRWKNPLDDGYRDIFIRVRLPNGHIAELQLNTDAIFEAKEFGLGHTIYEIERTLEPIAGSKGGDWQTLMDDLKDVSRRYYNRAALGSGDASGISMAQDSAVSRDIGVPLSEILARASSLVMGTSLRPLIKNPFHDSLSKAYGDPSLSKYLKDIKTPPFMEKLRQKGGDVKEKSQQPPVDPNAPVDFMRDIPARNVALSELSLSSDVPNFKEGADEQGVVKPLKGDFITLGTPPIVVWERNDGTLEVITGRHRLDLASRRGRENILAQVVREADGFTQAMAKTVDAESNIRDNQGTVKDYANYFRHTTETLDEKRASRRGLLRGDKGRAGFIIGRGAGDNLYALFRNDKIGPGKTSAIAAAAPKNEELQQLGITYAKRHGIDETASYLKAIQTMVPDTANVEQLDMFGQNQGWQVEADKMARAAARMMKGLKDERSALRAAGKLSKKEHRKILKRYGVKAGDPEAISNRLKAIDRELAYMEKWHTDPDLLERVRQEAGLNAPPGLVAKEQFSLFGKPQEQPFQLTPPEPTPAEKAEKIRRAASGMLPKRKKKLRFQADRKIPTATGAGQLHLFGTPEGAQQDLFDNAKEKVKFKKPRHTAEKTLGSLKARQRSRMVSTGGAVRAASWTVDGVKSAAALLRQIRRQAQETLFIVTTDKDHKVLEVHRLSKGTVNSGPAPLVPSMGRVFNIPDAAHVYAAHNHPSGDPLPSPQDHVLTDTLKDLGALKGITVESLVLGEKGWRKLLPMGGATRERRIPIAPATEKIPVKERIVVRHQNWKKSPVADSPSQAVRVLLEHFDNGDGMLLMDQKNRVLGFLPWPAGKPTKTAAAEVVAALENTNANMVVVNSPTKNIYQTARQDFLNNLARTLPGDLQILDVLEKGSSWATHAPDRMTIFKAKGMTALDIQTAVRGLNDARVMRSLGRGLGAEGRVRDGMYLQAVQNQGREMLKGFSGFTGRMFVLPGVANLGKKNLKKANIDPETEIVRGLHVVDGKGDRTVYLFADALESPKAVADTLLEEMFHDGISTVLGDQAGPVLEKVYQGHEKDVRQAVEQYNLDLATPEGRREAADEWIAKGMVKDTLPAKVWQEVVAVINSALRKAGIDVQYSVSEIKALARRAVTGSRLTVDGAQRLSAEDWADGIGLKEEGLGAGGAPGRSPSPVANRDVVQDASSLENNLTPDGDVVKENNGGDAAGGFSPAFSADARLNPDKATLSAWDRAFNNAGIPVKASAVKNILTRSEMRDIIWQVNNMRSKNAREHLSKKIQGLLDLRTAEDVGADQGGRDYTGNPKGKDPRHEGLSEGLQAGEPGSDAQAGSASEPLNSPTRFRASKSRKPTTENRIYDGLTPEQRARFESSRGLGKLPFREKVKQQASAILSERHHFKHLKDEYGQFSDPLRLLEGVGERSTEKAVNDLVGITKGLGSEDNLDMFTQALVMDDMVKDIESGLLEATEEGLPFGFETRKQAADHHRHIMKLVAETPAVKEALEKRKAHMTGLRDRLVSEGLLDERVQKDDRYFHHEVLKYRAIQAMGEAYQEKAGAGTGEDLRLKKKGWQRARSGSLLDYNTDYFESEFEVMSQAHIQLEIKKTLDTLQERGDIHDSLKFQAKQHNEQGVLDRLRKEGKIEKHKKTGEEISPFLPFSMQVARANGELAKMAAKGELDAPEQYKGLVKQLAASHRQGAPGVDHPKWFPFLGYLLGSQVAGSQQAAMIFKAGMDKQNFIKETLGKGFKTWEDFVPEGYVLWDPTPDGIWFKTNTIDDQMLEEIRQGTRAVPDKVAKVWARVPAKKWVIPEELARTLDEFQKAPSDWAISKASRFLQASWKQWTLINPYRIVKYNLNNMSGDADIVFAYDPKILTTYGKQAAKDLWIQWRKTPTRKLQAELDRARELEVIGSGWAVQEVEDLKRVMSGKRYMDVVLGKKPHIVARYWQGSKNFTVWRENMLRLAAFRYFQDQIKAGRKPGENLFGASNGKELKKLAEHASPDELAARLARDLIGDYGNVSHAGQWLRRHAIPFYSWMEVNSPRYYRMLQNLPQEGRTRESVAKAMGLKVGWKGTMLAAKASMLYGAISLWNHLFFPDEEEELGESARRQLHLILGRRADGSIRTLRLQGALSDVLSFVGLEDFPQDIADLAAGKKTAGDMAVQAGNAFLNRWTQGIRPDIKTSGELIFGQSLYPEILNPRPIRDRWEHVARLFSMQVPYSWIAGKPKRGGDVTGKLFSDLMSMGFYMTDPGEQAYWDTKKLTFDYMEKQGQSPPRITPTAKQNAMYYYKQALRYGDLSAAQDMLKRYLDEDGTLSGMEQSVKASAPLSAVKKDREGFLLSLTPDQKKKVMAAENWFTRVYKGSDGQGSLKKFLKLMGAQPRKRDQFLNPPIVRADAGKPDAPVDFVEDLMEKGALKMAPPSRYYTRAGVRKAMTDAQYRDYMETSSRLARGKLTAVAGRRMPAERQGMIAEKIIRNARRIARKRVLARRMAVNE